jgi:flavin reductase (DIM6/NTAB) family NADH-FMN oxidoreductase RutF
MTSHREIAPRILYFGTPVALIGTLNPDSTTNLAPMSSAWALGYTVLLGLGADGQTLANLDRAGECTINLPDDGLWRAVESLAPLTGREEVPAEKRPRFRFEADKFGAAGLTPEPSERVRPQRVRECPLQLEAVVEARHAIGARDDRLDRGLGAVAVEVRVVAVHARGDLIVGERHIDPRRWRPLLYSFRHYFGLGTELGHTFRSETPT